MMRCSRWSWEESRLLLEEGSVQSSWDPLLLVALQRMLSGGGAILWLLVHGNTAVPKAGL